MGMCKAFVYVCIRISVCVCSKSYCIVCVELCNFVFIYACVLVHACATFVHFLLFACFIIVQEIRYCRYAYLSIIIIVMVTECTTKVVEADTVIINLCIISAKHIRYECVHLWPVSL